MKKRGILYLTLLFSICLLGILYVMLGYYYENSFTYGTWINHVYCTGKTVDEANEEIKKVSSYKGITVKCRDGQVLSISANDIDYSMDFHAELQKIFDKQSPLLWGLNIIATGNKKIKPEVSFDEEKLRDHIYNQPVFQTETGNLYDIRKSDSGFYLEERSPEIPDVEAIYSKVKSAILNMDEEINVADDGECYVKAYETGEDAETLDLFGRVDKLQSTETIYKLFDEEIKFGKEAIADCFVMLSELEKYRNEGDTSFLVNGKESTFPDNYRVEGEFLTDSDGVPILNLNKLYEKFSRKFLEYDTNNCLNNYQNDGSSMIYVSGNKDGKLVDIDKEFEFLVSSLAGGENSKEISVPAKSFVIDGKELGDEYILVDMTNQHLKYIKGGVVNIEYDIVTGNILLGRGTPVGFYHIYNKRYHTILRGADYESYVNYWLGVNKGIGIHDAPWRSKFGENIYKSSGSHGCINSPFDEMQQLYNTVEVGVPVLLYY